MLNDVVQAYLGAKAKVIDPIVEKFSETDVSIPCSSDGPLWPYLGVWPMRQMGATRYAATCVMADYRLWVHSLDTLYHRGVDDYQKMIGGEPMLSFLYLKCLLTRAHVAIDSLSQSPDERYCANCYKPMPGEPLGFWDPVTRVYRY